MFYTVFIAKRFQHPVPSKVVIEEVMKGVTKGEIEGVTKGEIEGVTKGEIEDKVNKREC